MVDGMALATVAVVAGAADVVDVAAEDFFEVDKKAEGGEEEEGPAKENAVNDAEGVGCVGGGDCGMVAKVDADHGEYA